MKKLLIKATLCAGFILTGALIFSACKKTSTTTTGGGSFTWTVGGVNYTANSDTAYLTISTIYAYRDVTSATGNIFEINLSSLAVGAYTLTAAGANQVNYITNPAAPVVTTSVSGTLNITANASNKLSGNFTTTLTGGTAMTGTFTDVPILP